jgi:hypothetical protein
MLKSVIAIIGSYVLSIVLVLCTDPLLSRLFPGDFARGHIPSNAALLSSTAMFAVISVFCAWLCARLAPGNAARCVRWFFVVGEALGTVATMLNWNKGWPHWYFISWLVVWPIGCWIGLLISGRRASQASAAAV